MNVQPGEVEDPRPDKGREVPAYGAPKESPYARTSAGRAKLVVIGNGMVGHHFWHRAHSRGLVEKYEIEVFGEEPHAAYDRVNLGRLLCGGTLEELTLESQTRPELTEVAPRLGARVVAIDRRQREVELANGERYGYDKLVIATGSRPVLPNLPGVGLDGVVVYRGADDAQNVRREALRAAERAEGLVVIGAGLLGLELAEQLSDLGVELAVVESASHLLPRQLDERAASVLYDVLVERGLEFHLNRRVASIEGSGPARLLVRLNGGEALHAGLVIFAVGVRPCDELARASGLACDLFGGIEVDSQLTTSDSRIFAIGDCARCAGMSYGLVAPGYEMAEVVVERLLGNDARFQGTRPATRLKLEAIEVFAIGESAFESPGVRAVVCQGERSYRRLSVRAGRVVGASAIGSWDELAQVQQAVIQQLPLSRSKERRLRENRSVWAADSLSLEQWPDNAPVCSCTGVTCGTLKRARAEGYRTVDALVQCTGAGSVCGSCRPLLLSLTAPAPRLVRSAADRALLWISAAAAVLVLLWLTLPAIPYASSVQGPGHDVLWRDPLLKQVTGFSLAFVLGLGSLFSLRKRVPALRWGAFPRWRVYHSVMGVAAALLAVAHTGFRLGSNINAVLMTVFLVCALSGALAGFAVTLESTQPLGVGPRLRASANRVHLYLAWPLPVLITFHVLKFYYF